MKSLTFFIGSAILAVNSAFCQAPIKQWDADFGADNNEQLYAVQQTADGGYIAGGYSDSGLNGDKSQSGQGSSDYWIVKTNALGVKQWDARFGGSSTDQLTALKQTSDGGYILGGSSFSGISGDKTENSRGQSDYWIVKIDGNGIKQWDARFGGNSYDELHSLDQTADGGYILGGFSISGANGDQSHDTFGGKDYWIVKVDALGAKQWDSRFGGDLFEELNSVKQTADGGFILGGYSLSGIAGNKTQPNQGLYDYWVVKTDANGALQWDADFGGINEDWLTQLQQTTDGGFVLGGWSWSGVSGDKTQPSQGDNDYWIVKTDANGVKQWDADFGGSTNDYLYAIEQTTDGGYVLGGYSSSAVSGDKTQPVQGGTDYWVVKTNNSGVKQWDVDFGGSDFDFLSSMKQTSEGGFILGGWSASDISGDKTQINKGVNDYWLVKISAGGTLATTSIASKNAGSLTAYPNPFSTLVSIEFSVSDPENVAIALADITGKEIKTIPSKNLVSGKNKITIDLSDIETGIYFCLLKSSGETQTVKIVKQ